jgi:hypothetical protein
LQVSHAGFAAGHHLSIADLELTAVIGAPQVRDSAHSPHLLRTDVAELV